MLHINNGDQLLVRVGKACNFKCNFCNVSDNESHVKLRESVYDIVRNFHYKLKYSNFTSHKILITISGGEPSIFKKETIFILKYIGSFFRKKNIGYSFDIQTNASLIDLEFAEKLRILGVETALVSFHTIDKSTFEKTIGVDYTKNYFKILEGMELLNRVGIKVSTNTILSKQNENSFLQTIKFLGNIDYIYNYNLGLIQPHGEAGKIINEIYPKYNEVSSLYNKSIFYLLKRGYKVTSHFVGLPACYIHSFKTSLEISTNKIFRQTYNINNKYLINNLNDTNKTHTEKCNYCLYNNICSGIWKKYVGLQRLFPIFYVRDFYNKFKYNNFCYKILYLETNLKKIYDSNIRQLIIPVSLFDKRSILKITEKSLKIGFYKISLLVDSFIDIDNEIIESGITNIQIDIKYVNVNTVNKIIDFSKRYGPQFGINIDIFIYTYSNTLLVKLINILKLLPSKYIKCFFIKKGTNSLYSFNKLLYKSIKLRHSVFTIGYNKNFSFYKYKYTNEL